ncbi:cell surface protein, partial [Listeria ivanovii]|uniref:bacterial Ig-like domain-containing protein n=1 Tax=Listeria ivanovii TaxID=1638 RepID=UPI000DC273A7
GVTIQVTVSQDLTTVNAHNSTLYLEDTWTVADNFDSAIDKEGDTVPFSDITVSGSVNTSVAGNYPVTYTYNGVSATIQVTVKDNLTAVNAHDSTIYTSDTWRAIDNLDSVLNKDGNPVPLADVTVTGAVNTNQAGTNHIMYTYDGMSTTITVTVKEDKSGISAHDSAIYVGDNWTAADNFDSAFDQDGNPVAFKDIQVTDTPIVNTSKAGAYQVTYSYGKVAQTITLTVKEIQTAVNAHDSILYTGDSWTAEDNFDSARDKDGQSVSFSDIQVSGAVDTAQAGTYPITYSYDGVFTTIQVTVKDPQTSIHAHDSVIYTGESWTAKDNFDSATDKGGEAVSYKDITIRENHAVDPMTAG